MAIENVKPRKGKLGLARVKSAEKEHKLRRKRRKAVYPLRMTEALTVDTAKPVDYSFQKFDKLHEVHPLTARVGRVGAVEVKREKFLSRSLWLNHNYLENLNNIWEMVSSVLLYPERLSLLDISCNQLKYIDKELTQFVNISNLYLHGNRLGKIEDIFLLRKLKRLHNLTLFGNPIYECTEFGNIRSVVLTIIPYLRKLDYSVATRTELDAPLNTLTMRMLKEQGLQEKQRKEFKCPEKKIDEQTEEAGKKTEEAAKKTEEPAKKTEEAAKKTEEAVKKVKEEAKKKIDLKSKKLEKEEKKTRVNKKVDDIKLSDKKSQIKPKVDEKKELETVKPVCLPICKCCRCIHPPSLIIQ